MKKKILGIGLLILFASGIGVSFSLIDQGGIFKEQDIELYPNQTYTIYGRGTFVIIFANSTANVTYLNRTGPLNGSFFTVLNGYINLRGSRGITSVSVLKFSNDIQDYLLLMISILLFLVGLYEVDRAFRRT
ncbi:hypothetical protein HS7_00080 [Sulfolobales archaeon HS-7]|nr:hypothetical protein HS7_00080 [Sulfolobales archaeon HS-7]